MELVVTTGTTRCAKLRLNRHQQQTNTLPVAKPTASEHRRKKTPVWNCFGLTDYAFGLYIIIVTKYRQSDNQCHFIGEL